MTKPKLDTKLIKALPLFNELDVQDIEDILRQNDRIISVIGFKPGEQIINEKRFDRRMYLMIKGKVMISKDVIGKTGKSSQEIVTVEGSGHFLGEITALTGKPRTATVTAVEDTVCIFIDVGLLMHTSSILLERVKHSFYPKVFEIICKRLENTDEEIVKLKQQVEELEKKLNWESKERLRQREDYERQIRKKRAQIIRLEEQLVQ